MAILLNRMRLPEDQRDAAKVEQAETNLKRPLAVLDKQLADRDQLLGGDFSIADLNAASVRSLHALVGFEGVAEYPHAAAWLAAATGRPSFARASQAGS